MTDSRRIVKVFLASPGDLSDERKAAKSVVDEHNSLTAEEFGYQVELIGWEDTVSVFGRPQAAINLDLDRCELFIGLMWKKWGTPPDLSATYSSGFEEEFETSVKRRLREGQPEISLLFKDIDPAFLSDPGEDLKKVLAFKEQLIAKKTILFEGFADIRDFEKKFRRCIWKYVARVRTHDLNEDSVKNQAPTTGGAKQQGESVTSPAETPLSIEGAKFLREFISKTERKDENENIEAVEIARFRLLSNLVGKTGNDDRALGVHDANLLFSNGDRFTFGDTELDELARTGLRHYTEENTPLWCWIAAMNGFDRQLLPFYSFLASHQAVTGAIAAMRLINEPLPSEYRNDFIATWFSAKSPSALRVAGLAYLGDHGNTGDLTAIRKEFDRGDNQTVGAAAEAIIRINLRDSREKGIITLYELQPTSVSQQIVDELFENDKALTTETLERGVDHRNSAVRSKVVNLLRVRRALTVELAEKLLNDGSASVRYDALMTLVDSGHPYSDAEAKRILETTARPVGFGLLRGFGAIESPDREAVEYLEQFQKQRLVKLKEKDLEDAAAGDSMFDQRAMLVLAERHFDRHGEELRRRVDDQYKAKFSAELALLAGSGESGKTSLRERLRSIETFMRKELTRQGLNIICRQAQPSDLQRVRSALKSGFVDYSVADVEYLRKFGEWEDIPAIIEAVQRPDAKPNRSIFWSESDNSKYRAAARAIYALGRTRLPEVLSMPAPSGLLAHLVAEIANRAFRILGDEPIMTLLHSEADQVRKSAAIKCVHALPRRRVAKLLASYISGDKFRYYNVVHWLDFGVSTPRVRALRGAENVLNKEWRS